MDRAPEPGPALRDDSRGLPAVATAEDRAAEERATEDRADVARFEGEGGACCPDGDHPLGQRAGDGALWAARR